MEPLPVSDTRGTRERGAAAVEFALIVPILVVLLFAIIEFGRGYNASITVTQAAREAIRPLALQTGDLNAARAAALATMADLPNAGTATVSTPVGQTTPCALGSTIQVTVSYGLPYSVPLWQSGTWNISRTAAMRCGG